MFFLVLLLGKSYTKKPKTKPAGMWSFSLNIGPNHEHHHEHRTLFGLPPLWAFYLSFLVITILEDRNYMQSNECENLRKVWVFNGQRPQFSHKTVRLLEVLWSGKWRSLLCYLWLHYALAGLCSPLILLKYKTQEIASFETKTFPFNCRMSHWYLYLFPMK